MHDIPPTGLKPPELIPLGLKPRSRDNPQIRREKYAALYRETHRDVLRFVGRRLGTNYSLSLAEDITADAYLIAWRRFAEIPAELPEARAWLFTVARNCLLNEQRGMARRGALQVRIADDAILTANREVLESAVDSHDIAVTSQLDLAAAWHKLSPQDQEVLALLAWENLNSMQAGKVLGISGAAFRMRLTRARNNFRKSLQPAPLPMVANRNSAELSKHQMRPNSNQNYYAASA